MESLTGPGETYGTVNTLAKWMAVDEINGEGGINGRMIELAIEDSKCNAHDAITAYNKLVDVDGVKIILGTTCSGAMLGVAPLAESDGVILFSASATNPDIADAGDYIFRTAMNDAQLGIDTGNVLWADGIRKLATINESTDYAKGVRRASVAQFEKRGGEVVAAEQYASDTTNFITHLTKLLNANPDAIHLAAQGEFSGGTIVKQLRELGYDGPIYSEVVPIGSEALNIAGDAATGLKAITAELDPSNNKAQKVLTSFRARYGYAALAWYIGSAYDDIYITAECLKKTGDDQDADGFRDCLYDTTWSGVIGNNYSFDEKGEVVGVNNVVVEVLPTAHRTENNYGYRVIGFPSNLTVQPSSTPSQAPLATAPTHVQFSTPPPMRIDPSKSYKAIFTMERGGTFEIQLFVDKAPKTVNNFVFLAREGYYDGSTFHRVIPGFMAQGGDPTGTGTGGPGYHFDNEFHPDLRHFGLGMLAMANSGIQNSRGTNGGQFYITYSEQHRLDGLNLDGSPKPCHLRNISCHAVFGRVIKGMEVVLDIQERDPLTATYKGDVIESVVINEE